MSKAQDVRSRFQKMLAALAVVTSLALPTPTLADSGQHGGAVNTSTSGFVDTKQLVGGAVNPTKLSDGLLRGTYRYCHVDHQPNCSAPNGYGDPTGTAGDLNRCALAGCGVTWQYHVKGTQTLLAPLLDTTGLGLDISQDQTDNDGVELMFGANNSYGRFVHTVSSSTDACFKVKLKIADVSGTDDLAIGWRKVEAAQANLDDYDEGAFVNVILGQLYSETILNGAATVTTTATGSTWADNAVHTVEVCIKGRQAYYYYDDVRIQKTVTYNFDTGEVILPVIFFLQATTTPGKVFLQEVEIYDGAEASDR